MQELLVLRIVCSANQGRNKKQGPGLVDRAVPGTAFWGMRTGRASRFTGAGGQGIAAGLKQLFEQGEGSARQPGPAGQAVVDEHGGRTELRMHGRGNTAEIIAINQHQQRHQADGDMFQSVDGTHEMQKFILHPDTETIGDDEPQALGFKNLRRQIQGLDVQHAQASVQAAFISGDMFGHAQTPARHRRGKGMGNFIHTEDFRALGTAHTGMPFNLFRHGTHTTRAKIQFFNHIGSPPVQVHRAGMRLPQGLVSVHTADDVTRRVDYLERSPAAAQLHIPVRALARGQQALSIRTAQQESLAFQFPHGPLRGLAPDQFLTCPQRRFRRRALQMAGQQHLVLRIEHGLFRRTAEKFIGVMDKKLIQRIFPGQQDHGGLLPLAAHASPALKRGHDGARIPDQNAQIQIPDVDAQLQRAGADHGQQLA